MSAQIRVESGISAGTTFWIDKPVLRVGSDPQCEICLPSTDLASHALTIEFRDGHYRTYNRAASAISVGGATVQPGGVADLPANQMVKLPGDLRLVLQFDGDPRPCPRPSESRRNDDFDFDAASDTSVDGGEEATAKKSSKTLVQLAVIGFCVLGGAAFLLMPKSEATVVTQEIPTFDTVVKESLDIGEPARERLQRLQHAESALVRGQFGLAKTRFSTLRSQLARRLETLPKDKRADLNRYVQYVEYRMSQL